MKMILLFSLFFGGCSTMPSMNKLTEQLSTSGNGKGTSAQGAITQCNINVKSNVDGVSVSIKEESAWKKTDTISWTTDGTYKTFSVPCSEHKIELRKECYQTKTFSADFKTKNAYDIYVDQDEWKKYAYLRTEYREGDSPSITITGLSQQPFTIRKNENDVRKLELRKYAIDISAQYKETKPDEIIICEENEISILNIVVQSPGEITTLDGRQSVVVPGKGTLRIVNEKSNSVFTLYSEFDKKSEKYKSPIVLLVPFGKYKVQYGKKMEDLIVNSPGETLIDLSIL
jgi:hypothetical protein